MKLLHMTILSATFVCCGIFAADGRAQDSRPPGPPQADSQANPFDGERPVKLLNPLDDRLSKLLNQGIPLNPEKTIFVDQKKKRVLLRTEVACQDCLLEMFCCLEQTKEHESVVWLRGHAKLVHVALLAVGAEPGKPAAFAPKFTPPSGQKINIFVNWIDDKGKLQRTDAQSWMRHSVSRYYSEKLPAPPPGVKLPLMELRFDPYNKEILWFGQMTRQQRDKLLTLWDDKKYQAAVKKFYEESQPRPMKAEFVFAGSYQFTPDGADAPVYAAEGGQLVCVANFASSVIDVKEASSADDGGQSYEAHGDRVPPRGTPVIVELVPDAGDKDNTKDKNNADDSAEESSSGDSESDGR